MLSVLVTYIFGNKVVCLCFPRRLRLTMCMSCGNRGIIQRKSACERLKCVSVTLYIFSNKFWLLIKSSCDLCMACCSFFHGTCGNADKASKCCHNRSCLGWCIAFSLQGSERPRLFSRCGSKHRRLILLRRSSSVLGIQYPHTATVPIQPSTASAFIFIISIRAACMISLRNAFIFVEATVFTRKAGFMWAAFSKAAKSQRHLLWATVFFIRAATFIRFLSAIIFFSPRHIYSQPSFCTGCLPSLPTRLPWSLFSPIESPSYSSPPESSQSSSCTGNHQNFKYLFLLIFPVWLNVCCGG